MRVAASLPNLEAFVVAADTLNFSLAARRLGLTPQAVSRAVGRLEVSIGVTLFRRTTRALHLTDAGARYQLACLASLQQLEAAEDTLRATAERVSGRLRLSAPTSYGHAVLPALLASFHDKHPGVDVEVSLSNGTVDFGKDDCDLAIRMGTLADHPGLKRVGLGMFSVGVFASPGYLKRHGTPGTLNDLAAHRLISFLMPRTNRPLPWTLHVDGVVHTVVPDQRLAVADDVMGLVSLAKAGLGLCQTYDMMAGAAVERGELVEVLSSWRGEQRAFSLVFPASPRLSRAARAFVAHARPTS